MSALEGKEDLFEEWKAKIVPTFLVRNRWSVCLLILNNNHLSFSDGQYFLGSSESYEF